MRAISRSRKVTVIATTRRYKQKWAQTAHPDNKKAPRGALGSARNGICSTPSTAAEARGGAHSTQSGLAVKHLIKGAVPRPTPNLSRQVASGMRSWAHVPATSSDCAIPARETVRAAED